MIASKTKKKIASQTNGLTSNFSAVQKNSVLRKFLQKKLENLILKIFHLPPTLSRFEICVIFLENLS